MVLQFPANANDMLLSGTLAGGEALPNRALAVDVPLGKGHIVMFALRPFWRWQTQGTYFLAFNAILNWDHLDAGKPADAPRRHRRRPVNDPSRAQAKTPCTTKMCAVVGHASACLARLRALFSEPRPNRATRSRAA